MYMFLHEKLFFFCRLPPDTGALISYLCEKLGERNKHSKIFMKFWKSNGHPLPFTTYEAAEMALTLRDVGHMINVYSEAAEMLTLAKVRLREAEGNHVLHMLMQCARMIADEDLTNGRYEKTNLQWIWKGSIQKFWRSHCHSLSS